MTFKEALTIPGAWFEQAKRNICIRKSFRNMAVAKELQAISSINDIPIILSFGTNYRPDPKRGFLKDKTIHPRVIQHKINTGEYGKTMFDCDDHAAYWCAQLLKNKHMVNKVYFAEIRFPKGDDGKNSGHAFCIFEGLDSKLYWADYNYPAFFTDDKTKIFDCMDEVCKAYGYDKNSKGMFIFEVKHSDKKTDSIKLHSPKAKLW